VAILGWLADRVLPKTQAWLHVQLRQAVGELRRPHEGGISYLDHFLKTGKTDGAIADLIAAHLLLDMAKQFAPERKGDLKLSVHYFPAPLPVITIGMHLIEGDHIYDSVFERFSLEFAPDPFEANLTPIAPPPEPKHQKPEQKQPAGKPVQGRPVKPTTR
jgi:hypothetical protein